MKIYVIGGPGSGKTFLANRLEKQLEISHYDLDDLQWDNKANTYGTKRNSQERDELLNNILDHDDWIIEGVYYAWCGRCFEDADKIYLLNVPRYISRYIYRYRIIKRFIRRKLGIEKCKKETLKSLVDLLKWADKYQNTNLAEIKKILANYSDKVIE